MRLRREIKEPRKLNLPNKKRNSFQISFLTLLKTIATNRHTRERESKAEGERESKHEDRNQREKV